MEIAKKERFDRSDLRILEHLQADARLSTVDLADRIGLSASPCAWRVRQLEDRGVISRRVTLLNPRQVGLPVSVFVSVTLEHQEEKMLKHFEVAVSEWPEVMECYLMTGDADYLLRIVAADLDAYQAFLMGKLTQLEGVANIRSSFALRQVRYETALPLTQLAP